MAMCPICGGLDDCHGKDCPRQHEERKFYPNAWDEATALFAVRKESARVATQVTPPARNETS